MSKKKSTPKTFNRFIATEMSRCDNFNPHYLQHLLQAYDFCKSTAYSYTPIPPLDWFKKSAEQFLRYIEKHKDSLDLRRISKTAPKGSKYDIYEVLNKLSSEIRNKYTEPKEGEVSIISKSLMNAINHRAIRLIPFVGNFDDDVITPTDKKEK